MDTISKETKRKGLFQDSHALEYALKVTERHVRTRQVSSVRCLFCIYVGREQKPDGTRVRQLANHSKDFTPPFRVKLFKKHHEGQHLSSWRRYQSVSNRDKSKFFDNIPAFANTLLAKFQPAQRPLPSISMRPLWMSSLATCFIIPMIMLVRLACML